MDKLTTGQMIDQLKIGEVAEDENGWCVAFDEERVLRFYSSRDEIDGKGTKYWISNEDTNAKWRIIPKFVSFEKAIRAFKEGKLIKSWTDNDYEIHYGEYLLNNLTEETITFNEILNAKWTIED
ncbi:hypothetical protein AB0Y20_00880 [Heyndrickxia oleronia]|uniref:hypothetical protein n=1 Tax=Heyndrickxia oleronia TaxID=38875 RepID=UPI003F219D5B